MKTHQLPQPDGRSSTKNLQLTSRSRVNYYMFFPKQRS